MADIKITQKYNTENHFEEIECVVDKADFDKNFENAIIEITKVVTAPGFRKGHVPKNVVMKNNFQQISDKAIDLAIHLAADNIKELDPRPLEPLNVKSITPTEDGGLTVVFSYIPMPTVKVGDFSKIKVAAKEGRKTDKEEVLKELTNIWFHYASRLDATLKKEDFSDEQLNAEFFEKSDIKKDNPALTNAEELKTFVENYINQTYEADANTGWEKEVQEKVIEASEFVKVDALIEKEIEKRVQNYKDKFTNIGLNADDYMKTNNVNIEDLKTEWKPQAERDVKLELVLQKYGEEKGFEPTEEEIKENVESLDDATKKMYNNDMGRITALIRYYYINQKSYNAIIEIVRKNSGIEKSTQKSDK